MPIANARATNFAPPPLALARQLLAARNALAKSMPNAELCGEWELAAEARAALAEIDHPAEQHEEQP